MPATNNSKESPANRCGVPHAHGLKARSILPSKAQSVKKTPQIKGFSSALNGPAPNQETQDVIKEVENGINSASFNSVDALFKDLEI